VDADLPGKLGLKLGDLVICGNTEKLCWIGILVGEVAQIYWFLELAGSRFPGPRASFNPYTQKNNLNNLAARNFRLLAEPEISRLPLPIQTKEA
jgi:hypothetical protein